MKRKYLTKSKFTTALSCPTKLYYADHKEYGNVDENDPFLKSLARGGYQVGHLACAYFPKGVEIKDRFDREGAIAQTEELLKQDNVTIFEAALHFEGFLVYVDILEKKGDTINLIEVKSITFDPNTIEDELTLKKDPNKLKSNKTVDYLLDLSFQTYVVRLALPGMKINSFLMACDKTKKASVDGLNQIFLVTDNEKGGFDVKVTKDLTKDNLGEEVLSKIDLSDYVGRVLSGDLKGNFIKATLSETIEYYKENYFADKKMPSNVGKVCKDCEFRYLKDDPGDSKKSGFKECFSAVGVKEKDFDKPFLFDIHKFPATKIDPLFNLKTFFAEDIDSDKLTINPRKNGESGLSQGERQQIQLEKIHNNDSKTYIDLDSLATEYLKVNFPLHMIDFETSGTALPFFKDRGPYEAIAFQFSHHIIYEDGRVEHAGEYLHSTPGEFPNFHFVRELKNQLTKDNGSIFRYHNHENTILLKIAGQLQNSDEPDKDELIEFIHDITITRAKGKQPDRVGKRNMIDLHDWIYRFYFSPMCGGSTSIKYILPAILNESKFIQEKYSSPIYGSEIKSFNFKNHKWIEMDGKEVKNPYKSLPPVMDKYEFEQLETLTSDSDLDNGGAALTAYGFLQYVQMSDKERQGICDALKRYCELDTMAMVMIFEHFQDLLNVKENKQVG